MPKTAVYQQIACALLALVSLALRAVAEPITIELDPAKTTISFVLDDVLHTVRGTFQLKAGHVEIDSAGLRISGLITVDAASGASGSSTRDRRMKRDILEADRFPEITFSPIAIKDLVLGANLSQATVTGLFAIHGQRHQIAFPVRVERSPGDLTATGSFVVPYVDWGMKDPSTFVLRVNKNVDVTVRAVGHIQLAR